MDDLLENNFQENENMKDCNIKICKNHLATCHMSVPEKLKDKRDVIAAHRELMQEHSHDLKHIEVQPHVFMVANWKLKL